MALLLGWNWSQGMDYQAELMNIDSPGAPILLLLWVAAVFLSILVHELGHSLAFSYFGTQSHIVLYHMGGLAIPGSFGSWNAARQRGLSHKEQMIVSAAGPFLQLALAGLALLIAYAARIPVGLPFVGVIVQGSVTDTILPYSIVNAVVYPSVFWALLNLLPVLPLDGGQIMRGFLVLFNVQNPYPTASMVSVVVGGLLGLLFIMNGRMFAGILFIMLAAENYQSMQYGGGGF